jgi:colanic acid biosynthesis glycosyl transferase WcaI
MKKILLIYHYFYPDQVISSRHFTQLAESLVNNNYQVDVVTSNRICHDPSITLKKFETYNGIKIHRIFRPSFLRNKFTARLFGQFFFIFSSVLKVSKLLLESKHHTIIIGTDPAMCYIQSLLIRMISKTKILLWSFDLYPQALFAANMLEQSSLGGRILMSVSSFCYTKFDNILSIGSCMSDRLRKQTVTNIVECTPWAITEQQHLENHDEHPPKNPSLNPIKFLYAGHLGNAHEIERIRQLMSHKFSHPLEFSFSVRKDSTHILGDPLPPSVNSVKILEFAPESELIERLTAYDIHLVTLKESWSGIVVPSKFFAAIAVGRPVLFIGPESSAIAKWISQYQLGWTWSDDNRDIRLIIESIIETLSDCSQKNKLNRRCYDAYQSYFSRDLMTKKIIELIEQ